LVQDSLETLEEIMEGNGRDKRRTNADPTQKKDDLPAVGLGEYLVTLE
jgi:hypothetical protein